MLTYILAGKRLDREDKKDRENKSVIMEDLGYLFSMERLEQREESRLIQQLKCLTRTKSESA